MTVWFFSCFACLYGFYELQPLQEKLLLHFRQSKAIDALRRSIHHLKLIQEMLESGMVPDRKDWEQIRAFPEPWGQILFESIAELRSQGAAILPTLRRMQHTLEEQTELILEGKVKSAQSMGQAVLGIGLVPIFGGILYAMIPEVQENTQDFILLLLFAGFFSSISFIWIVSMVDQARFGNLRTENRRWLVSVNVSFERLLALISTGLPPDLAWKKTIEELAIHDSTLARDWKALVWDPDFSIQSSAASEVERLILNLGVEVRRSIQTSLLEGRPCLDRIESIHRTFLLDLRMKISRELSLLPNRCLKPLFILVLPSVMLVLFGSLYFTVKGFLQ